MKSTTIDYAHVLNGVDPYVEVQQSAILRWGLYCFLLERWDEIPAEVRGDLNREFLENEIEDIPKLEESS